LELLKPTQTWVVCPMEDAGYEIAPGVSICGIDAALRKAQESAWPLDQGLGFKVQALK